jgi:hypothetical protein
VKRGDLSYVRLDGGAFAFELEDVRAFARERRIACSPLARHRSHPANRQAKRG